jgi:hypothetical protein
VFDALDPPLDAPPETELLLAPDPPLIADALDAASLAA